MLTDNGIYLNCIGVAHTPYKSITDCPRNSRFSEEIASIVIYDKYVEALTDIESSSHIFVFYWLDQANRKLLKTITKYDGVERGVFANRSPHRPNPIGISVAKLIGRQGGVLTIQGIDCIDETPIIDIKPYITENDCVPDATNF